MARLFDGNQLATAFLLMKNAEMYSNVNTSLHDHPINHTLDCLPLIKLLKRVKCLKTCTQNLKNDHFPQH